MLVKVAAPAANPAARLAKIDGLPLGDDRKELWK
jgi:hypothetical protein